MTTFDVSEEKAFLKRGEPRKFPYVFLFFNPITEQI